MRLKKIQQESSGDDDPILNKSAVLYVFTVQNQAWLVFQLNYSWLKGDVSHLYTTHFHDNPAMGRSFPRIMK